MWINIKMKLLVFIQAHVQTTGCEFYDLFRVAALLSPIKMSITRKLRYTKKEYEKYEKVFFRRRRRFIFHRVHKRFLQGENGETHEEVVIAQTPLEDSTRAARHE